MSTGEKWKARVDYTAEFVVVPAGNNYIVPDSNNYKLQKRKKDTNSAELIHTCGNGTTIYHEIDPQQLTVTIKDGEIVAVGKYYQIRWESLYTILCVNNLRLSKKLEKKLFRDNKRK